MPSDDLLKYIRGALQTGATKGIIKSSLIGAGWEEADVDAGFKVIEGENPKPQSTSSAVPSVSFGSHSAGLSQSAQTKPGASGTIKLGGGSILSSLGKDPRIVSMSGGATSALQGAPRTISSPAPISSPAVNTPAVISQINNQPDNAQRTTPQIAPLSAQPASQPLSGGAIVSGRAPSKKWMWVSVILGVLCLALFGLSAFVYFSSNEKIAGMEAENVSLKAKVVSLESKPDAGETPKAPSPEAVNNPEDVLNELSFFIVVPALGDATTARTISINGIVGGGGAASYTLTTPHGVALTISNSNQASVKSVFAQLVAQSVEITGSYKMGTRAITVTDVNGTSVSEPAGAATP